MTKRTRRPILTQHLLAAIALLACAAGAAQAQDFNDRAPNAPDQRPAVEGQTRAPVLDANVRLNSQVVADGLEHPWGMAQLPDGRWLVTERPGRLRLINANGKVSEPIAGLPAVDARGQGGLLDVVRPEHGGTLVTAGDRAALATAIARLLHDPVARAQAGTQGHAFVQARFTPAAVAERYLAVYDEARR